MISRRVTRSSSSATPDFDEDSSKDGNSNHSSTTTRLTRSRTNQGFVKKPLDKPIKMSDENTIIPGGKNVQKENGFYAVLLSTKKSNW